MMLVLMIKLAETKTMQKSQDVCVFNMINMI